jgi:hypothetical protein
MTVYPLLQLEPPILEKISPIYPAYGREQYKKRYPH